MAPAINDFKEEEFTSAKMLLAEVAGRYPKSSHRLGIAMWLLGLTLWKNQEYETAHANWSKVCGIFSEIAKLKVQQQASDGVRWYTEKIDLLRLDLACTAEEANAWLTMHTGRLWRHMV